MFKGESFKLRDKTALGRIVFTPPFKGASAFDNEARFVYVLNGNSRLHAPKVRLDLKTGDSILMKCENFVNNWLKNENDAPSEIIIVYFYPEILQHIYGNNIPKVFNSSHTIQVNPVERIKSGDVLQSYVKSLQAYFKDPGLINDEAITIKLRELIHILINSDTSGEIKSILGDLFNTNEYEFKEVVHANIFEDISIEDLAFLTGLSLSSFKRKFKSVFNISPGQYIKAKRLEKGKDLLANTNLRISEVAYDCGYNDVSYFSKSFTSLFKISPSAYREVHS